MRHVVWNYPWLPILSLNPVGRGVLVR
jgi:hypothetical protein